MTEAPVRSSLSLWQNPYIEEWLEKQTLELAGNVTRTTLDQVEDVIKESSRLGSSVDHTAQDIRRVFDDAGDKRAKTIARTELNKAANGASWLQATESGVATTKTWLTAGDARVREEHVRMNGETVGIDDRFSNGSMFPDEVNCRCTLTYGIDQEAIREPSASPRAQDTPTNFVRKARDLGPRDVLPIGKIREEIVGAFSDQVEGNTDVVLTGSQRRHYLERHPELAAVEFLVQAAVLEPDEVHRNARDSDLAIFYKEVDAGLFLRLALVMQRLAGRLKHSIITARYARAEEVERGRSQDRRI